MTLQEAIANLVTTGESDPLTIARKIAKRNDQHWLSKELLALAERAEYEPVWLRNLAAVAHSGAEAQRERVDA